MERIEELISSEVMLFADPKGLCRPSESVRPKDLLEIDLYLFCIRDL
jgi:hypothetical protein